jgi:hypothetical protein
MTLELRIPIERDCLELEHFGDLKVLFTEDIASKSSMDLMSQLYKSHRTFDRQWQAHSGHTFGMMIYGPPILQIDCMFTIEFYFNMEHQDLGSIHKGQHPQSSNHNST